MLTTPITASGSQPLRVMYSAPEAVGLQLVLASVTGQQRVADDVDQLLADLVAESGHDLGQNAGADLRRQRARVLAVDAVARQFTWPISWWPSTAASSASFWM